MAVIDELTGNLKMFLATGFGEDFLIGILIGYLKRIRLPDCIDFIDNNKDLLAEVTEQNWVRFRTFAKHIKLENITVERVISELRNERPDVLSIIINHPAGKRWLSDTVDRVHANLKPPD